MIAIIIYACGLWTCIDGGEAKKATHSLLVKLIRVVHWLYNVIRGSGMREDTVVCRCLCLCMKVHILWCS